MVPLTLLGYYYWHYQQFYDELLCQHQIEYRQANAIKHAYAAAELYIALEDIGFSPARAEEIVIALGKGNERLEQWVDNWDNPDITPEIMRDLYNNQVGVTAAQWYHAHVNRESLRQVIIDLGKTQVLIPNELVPMLASAKNAAHDRDIAFAIHWFDAQRFRARAATLEALKNN